MQGQWIGKISGGLSGTLRVELEDRGSYFGGAAYLFYDPVHELPGFAFDLKVPKGARVPVRVEPTYCHPLGGIMSLEERRKSEADLAMRTGEAPLPDAFEVHLSLDGVRLKIEHELDGVISEDFLDRSEVAGASDYRSRADLPSWDVFRQWAVNQNLRKYIFRGQSKPYKLSSTFHRTWRSDIHAWVHNDVPQVFRVLADKLTYPLQLGNLEHNSAVWSILQHHGYPTPMLDWSFSPFVAAYFAFAGVDAGQSESARIFIFDQEAWSARRGRKAFIVDAAPTQLVVLESLPVGNPRSGPQQALSTVTNVVDVEKLIRQAEEEDGQSYLTVCDLHGSQRPQIMRELELMGITFGSLFPSIEGLCSDMKDRLFKPPA